MDTRERTQKLAHDIRTKIYGRDVREALATGIEESGNTSQEARDITENLLDGSYDTGLLNTEIEQRMNNLYSTKGAAMDELYTEKDTALTNLYENEKTELDNLQADYADRAETLETTYAPKLTEVTAQLAQTKDKLDNSTVVSVRDYGAKGDGVTDDTEAIQTAIDENEQILFPKGKYKLSKSLIIRDGKNTQLIGAGTETLNRNQEDTAELLIDGFTGIEVPHHDNPIEQVTIGLKNMTIRGTGQEIGVNGVWGGVIKNCLFVNLLVGTKTEMGWASTYYRTAYYMCDTGLISEQSYNVEIVKCHFSHFNVGLDTGRESVSLLIQQNILNLDDDTQVGMVVTDGVNIDTNYFENFGTNNKETYSIDYSFSRFANPTLNMQSNFLRGNNKMNTHLKISDYIGHQYLNEIAGTIKNNQFTQTLQSPIQYEEGRLFHGLEVENNQSEQPIDTPLIPFKPYYQSTLGLNLNLNNNEFEDIPAPYLTYYNGNNLEEDNQFKAPISGVYEITYSVTLGSRLVDEMEDNTVGIYTAGEMVHESRVTVKTGKTPEGNNETNVVTVTGSLITKLNRTNKVTIRGKGQSRVRRGYLTVKCLDNFTNKDFTEY